jgi:hypothetical protein
MGSRLWRLSHPGTASFAPFTPTLDEESLNLAADPDEKFEVLEISLDEKRGVDSLLRN